MDKSVIETGFLGPSPPRHIARVSATAPLRWFKAGVEDLFRFPLVSLVYGVLFTAIVYGVLKLFQSTPVVTLGYLMGLLFWIPFLAAGLFAARRDLEPGSSSAKSGIRLLWQRKTYLALFSIMLLALLLGWLRLASLLLVVHFGTPLAPTEVIGNLISSPDGWLMVVLFSILTFLMATLIFAVSAISLPLILDGDADLVNAMITSYLTTVRNPSAMLLWAAIIILLTTCGIAAWFIGLALVFPILSYATWHSYRDLVI